MDYENYFDSNGVPTKLKQAAIAIMKRYTISGICDAMYICNVVAFLNGLGDGSGHFYDIADERYISSMTASYLQKQYGANIFPEDVDELHDILNSGRLDPEKAIAGMQKFEKKCREEMEQSDDDWRKEYLDRCINLTEQNIAALAAA